MRYVSLDTVEPGHVLARSIYASDSRTLLQQGVHLTVGMINQLRRVGVQMIYIESKYTDDVKIEDVVSEETRRQAMSNLASAVQCVQGGKEINVKDINNTVNNIIDEILKNKEVLLHLSDIRTEDNELFVHSQNVCIMSILIGIKLGLTQTQLKDLAMGAILHDIGKVVKDQAGTQDKKKIPSYASKDDDHTWKGFNLLRKRHDITTVAAHIPLQHHEHIDGTGFPRGIEGAEIQPLAKIVAVANHFDNLISNIAGNEMLLPHEACEIIMGYTNSRFDHKVVVKFLESVALYPTGSSVLLSTGDAGIVINQHNGLPARPIVRVIRKYSQEDQDPEIFEIDLAKETTIFIKRVLA
ncbi:metal-dependent phosphohydrolase [Desulfuribacillus stibiiarsenatis]|uniref:Metal-dependent phosphohydrolase n=1 Tax=Desulfuribacillus stibiiarsenatis TaxID=1390249 RepID=A0A1E5L6Z3_9FIRM|nr:HD domain-containing phosphohydrolase [Desulfuribacillus stibiiarsenatis]OEH85915.1 metal-dependent phosphohydrolase [Desulfuribacillus stibiiarsenatis]